MEKTHKIITMYLPEKYLTAIQTLNDYGLYSNRSEFIRIALRDFLAKDLKTNISLETNELRLLIRGNRNR